MMPEAIMEVSSPRVSTRNILFATDFSERSGAALPYAISLARKPGGRLFVAHVVSMGTLGAGFPVHEWLMATAQGVREAQADMHRIEGRLSAIEHKTFIRTGDVVAEIDGLVKSETIDVLVLGTHGRRGISKVVLGSVAERLFRHAICPVLTIGPHVSADPDHVEDVHSILYATDFSAEAQAALDYTSGLAQDHGARLYLLHVMSDGTGAERDELEKRLYGLLPQDARFDCEPKARVEKGAPGSVILSVAEELAVDLIVMGPKRRSGLPGTMAATYHVVSQATCPVLTVRG
jgi:nucleotide-binding universal stress UspA family protein